MSGQSTDARSRPYMVVDVFTARATVGNPVAVVLDGSGLDVETMQQYARWTNLSETTFILPPTDPANADYKLKIFTPQRQLPFAGHPTLGSCRAWLASGGVPRAGSAPEEIIQECDVGLVKIKRSSVKSSSGADNQSAESGRLSFLAPPFIREGPMSSEELAFKCSGLDINPSDVLLARWIDNGPGWCGLILKDAKAVLNINFNGKPIANVGVIGPYKEAADKVYAKAGKAGKVVYEEAPHEAAMSSEAGTKPSFEMRVWASHPGEQWFEDPTTGSFNAGAAQWLISEGLAESSYVAAQGRKRRRDGRVYISSNASSSRLGGSAGIDVWVGGDQAIPVKGTVIL
ncbi:Predicted PhzC/PhzF-type epimerase [Ceraceosorus bombacis]|uniref:Predicted PhzC/PhzF-type epimerase n=1 Tax=Ceraceosorus bombacis TaxID=401625 RepID=A0A0P1BA13_9BASI|nr:Predicted PhzC/PhzF-type epimerase [Ceraceosorus bombacis]